MPLSTQSSLVLTPLRLLLPVRWPRFVRRLRHALRPRFVPRKRPAPIPKVCGAVAALKRDFSNVTLYVSGTVNTDGSYSYTIVVNN